MLALEVSILAGFCLRRKLLRRSLLGGGSICHIQSRRHNIAFTYSDTSTADRDRVRREIGDTAKETPLFTDGEIADFVTIEGSWQGAAAHACEALATRYAREFSFSADGSSFQKDRLSVAFAEAARRLRNSAKADMVTPTRVDGYSSEIASDDVTSASGARDFDRGRWDE